MTTIPRFQGSGGQNHVMTLVQPSALAHKESLAYWNVRFSTTSDYAKLTPRQHRLQQRTRQRYARLMVSTTSTAASNSKLRQPHPSTHASPHASLHASPSSEQGAYIHEDARMRRREEDDGRPRHCCWSTNQRRGSRLI